MLWIDNDGTDPAWNLAAEEYLLRSRRESIAMLWRNGRSVIIGKNQDMEAEVDTALARERGIPVVRRITGGGAVFHDLGNVNYTYMFTFEGKHEMDFGPFARPIVAALAEMGVTGELSGRNDILVGGKKVSGCAHACVGDRALYHGTLLFSADLSQMDGLLRYSEEKYQGRGIRSVSARVENLNHWLAHMDVETFMERLRALLSEGSGRYVLSAGDAAAIDRLRAEAYAGPVKG
ncbi:MAG: lipoate--protein ligase family protein [Oscillospiraceae bacterium]|nr:lipoate--protein ligase family protein [Oscillospiraceae bacterium]